MSEVIWCASCQKRAEQWQIKLGKCPHCGNDCYRTKPDEAIAAQEEKP